MDASVLAVAIAWMFALKLFEERESTCNWKKFSVFSSTFFKGHVRF